MRERVQPDFGSGRAIETGERQRLARRNRQHLRLGAGTFQRIASHRNKRGEGGGVHPLRRDVIGHPAAPTGGAVALRDGALPLLLLVRVRKQICGDGRLRRLIQEQVGSLFGTVDVLLAPGRAAVAPKIDTPLDRGGGGAASPKDPGFRSIIPMGNLAGLPALVLPCGFADNMPVALQLVGVPFSENTLLAIGREFQARTDWHKRRPPAA